MRGDHSEKNSSQHHQNQYRLGGKLVDSMRIYWWEGCTRQKHDFRHEQLPMPCPMPSLVDLSYPPNLSLKGQPKSGYQQNVGSFTVML